MLFCHHGGSVGDAQRGGAKAGEVHDWGGGSLTRDHHHEHTAPCNSSIPVPRNIFEVPTISTPQATLTHGCRLNKTATISLRGNCHPFLLTILEGGDNVCARGRWLVQQ